MLTDNFDDPEIEILNFDWTMRKTIWDEDLKKKKKQISSNIRVKPSL